MKEDIVLFETAKRAGLQEAFNFIGPRDWFKEIVKNYK